MGTGNAVIGAAQVLLAGLYRPSHKNGRGFCSDCRGKGFDLTRGPGRRSARKCQRCRGEGYVAVGGTKR